MKFELLKMHTAIVQGCSSDELRPAMMCMYVEKVGEALKLVATNGHVLFQISKGAEVLDRKDIPKETGLIPRDLIVEYRRFQKGNFNRLPSKRTEDTVNSALCVIGKRRVNLIFDGLASHGQVRQTALTGQAVEEKYPDYPAVMHKKHWKPYYKVRLNPSYLAMICNVVAECAKGHVFYPSMLMEFDEHPLRPIRITALEDSEYGKLECLLMPMRGEGIEGDTDAEERSRADSVVPSLETIVAAKERLKSHGVDESDVKLFLHLWSALMLAYDKGTINVEV